MAERISTELLKNGNVKVSLDDGTFEIRDQNGAPVSKGYWRQSTYQQTRVDAAQAVIDDWHKRDQGRDPKTGLPISTGVIRENQDAYNFAVLTLKREQELLDIALKNEREDAIARVKAEAADAKAADKGSGAGSGSAPAPVSKQIVPPNMTMVEKDPARPGVYVRYQYVFNPATGKSERQELGDTTADPLKATDFYAQPNGDIYSLTAFDQNGNLKKDEAGNPVPPVFKAALQYTQSTTKIVNGVKHTFVYDKSSPETGIDMGPAEEETTKLQTKALTDQYKAQAASTQATANTTEYDLAQKKEAVKYGEEVYRKDLTAAGALLKLGKIDEAQKAFDAAQKNWEATSAARMREKENALTKGQEAASGVFLRQALGTNAMTPEQGRAYEQSLYDSISGKPGDSAVMRLARRAGYSDAIDFQRGPAMTWNDFVNNNPLGAIGNQLVTGPALPDAIKGPAVSAGASVGKAVDLGNGLFWWDDGTPNARGEIFYLAQSGATGADGWPEKTMVPKSLDSAGLYKGKTLEEARAIAAGWFGAPAAAPAPIAPIVPSTVPDGAGALAPAGRLPTEPTSDTLDQSLAKLFMQNQNRLKENGMSTNPEMTSEEYYQEFLRQKKAMEEERASKRALAIQESIAKADLTGRPDTEDYSSRASGSNYGDAWWLPKRSTLAQIPAVFAS